MLIKIHKAYRDVVAVCDKELLGRYFEEGRAILDVRETFFNGEEKNHHELKEILQDLSKEDSTFMIIGKRSTDCAIEAGIIAKEGTKTVQGIPFALILL